MTRAVIWDVGNVLLRWDARLVYRGMGLDEAAIDAFFDEVAFDAWNLEQDRGRSWADAVAEHSALHPTRAELLAAFHERWQESVPGLIDGSVAILGRLREAGAPLYAITNFSVEKWAETTERFPVLRDSFRDVVVSAHERLVKPDPRIYRALLDRNGLDAASCVFIDDSEKNVAGAAAVGLDAIRFTTPEALEAALAERGLP